MQKGVIIGIAFYMILATSCKTVEFSESEMILNKRNNMLFITLQINNKKGLFLLDTGAGISLIDYNQAKRYGFNIGSVANSGTITGVGGNNRLFTVYNIDVMYEHFERSSVKFYGSDFSGINDVFDQNSIRILGILGSDFLSANQATINYKTKKLMLSRRE